MTIRDQSVKAEAFLLQRPSGSSAAEKVIGWSAKAEVDGITKDYREATVRLDVPAASITGKRDDVLAEIEKLRKLVEEVAWASQYGWRVPIAPPPASTDEDPF